MFRMTPTRRIVETMPAVHIREVRRVGLLPGTSSALLGAGNIRLVWRAMPFGGQRAYFQCPRCFRSTDILYRAPFLACRTCHGLAYRSENLTPLWRKNQRWQKARRRLGVDTSCVPAIIPAKVKWQRWHTYLALRRAIQEADRDFAVAWLRSRVSTGLNLG